MNRKHLSAILSILLICILLFTSCSAHSQHMHTRRSRRAVESGSGETGSMTFGMGYRWTFESAVEIATDVVVAEFVERRPFGQSATEYEFVVHDRIFGNAADTIFVYVVYDEMSHRFADSDFKFAAGTQYLLTLIILANIYASFHYDGYMFASDLILNLDDPSKSTMYGQTLSAHSYMNFDSSGLAKEHVISYVRSLPRNPYEVVDRVFITSDNLREIIINSPYVLVIEIGEPRRLASQALQSDLQATDIYYATVVEALKGDMEVGKILPIIFFADTVSPGETHLVSIAPSDPAVPYFYRFTSRNSLHSLDQRDEIISIIRGPRHAYQTDPTTDTTASPAPTPQPTPIPNNEQEITEDENSSRFTASLYEPDAAANIALINIEVDLPEDFVAEMLLRDNLNVMFLQEEMHSLAVLGNEEDASDIRSIVSVYIGDLGLSDMQTLMLRGFVIDPHTGSYTVIPGTFSTDRNYFYFEVTGSGIIGAFVYELPVPLLRLAINQYNYYYRGLPLTSDAAPFITQNRTMVPIRLVSEALSATPRWDRATRTAYIYYNDTVLRLPVDYPLPDEMGTPVLRNSRVLVPLRFVIENFDAVTFWEPELREVTVFILD